MHENNKAKYVSGETPDDTLHCEFGCGWFSKYHCLWVSIGGMLFFHTIKYTSSMNR